MNNNRNELFAEDISHRKDELMHQLARFIEAHSEETLSLKTLSKEVHLSPEYLQKRFRTSLGVSPKEFQENCRMRKLKSELQSQTPIAECIYSAGYGSPSRVYEKLDSQLGMTPGEYRSFGKGVEISYAECDTSFGPMMIGATDRGICFLQFAESSKELRELLAKEFPEATLSQMSGPQQEEQFFAWMESLKEYLLGQSTMLTLPIDMRGSVLQQKVWKYLQTIPRGEQCSYAEVAAEIGHPRAARAVASACAKNRIAILIPCHRVLRGTGELAGYRWGIERKKRLITIEESPIQRTN